MKSCRPWFLALICCLVSASLLHAQTPKGEAKPLFDGKTLNGWKVVTCEAEVQDGTILIKSGNGVVATERKYADYILELDWKALKPDAWDSGVYIRCEMPKGKRPWPPTYQVNLQKGVEGNIAELKGASSKGMTKPGEWNHFKITVIGSTVALEINGKPAWKADGLKEPTGYICLQAEVPGGGQFLFKDIKITELGGK